jgi:hypothetical protein
VSLVVLQLASLRNALLTGSLYSGGGDEQAGKQEGRSSDFLEPRSAFRSAASLRAGKL